jgi:PKHD-type hydroxylase
MQRIGVFVKPMSDPLDMPSHVQWSEDNAILSPPECDALIALGEKAGLQPASIGSPTEMRVDPKYRAVDVAMIPLSEETLWIYKRIADRVTYANDQYFKFDLQGLVEELQLLRYKAPEGEQAHAGHYHWHQDFGAGYMARRKLSVTINLSAPADYEGCRLTLMTHFQHEMPYVGKGDGVVFPSWTPHMVSDISRGTRYALVAWVHGTPFR